MTEKIFEFKTKKEADAFVAGVEFVNDSAIEVNGISHNGRKFVVSVEDADSEGGETD